MEHKNPWALVRSLVSNRCGNTNPDTAVSIIILILLQTRVLDVDVDNANTGRASLVAIARAAGVRSPLVTYEQVRDVTGGSCR